MKGIVYSILKASRWKWGGGGQTGGSTHARREVLNKHTCAYEGGEGQNFTILVRTY